MHVSVQESAKSFVPLLISCALNTTSGDCSGIHLDDYLDHHSPVSVTISPNCIQYGSMFCIVDSYVYAMKTQLL